MTDPKRLEAAKILLDTRSVLFNPTEPFVLTSGEISPVYVDIRRLISFPKERTILMDMASDLLKDKGIEYAAGGETAGIPYAAFIAERLNIPMLYVRKKPKGFGRMSQIEGCMDDTGQNVALIEDLQTDGGSKKLFIDVLREAGSVVEHAFVVFHYGIFPQSLHNMKEMGVELHSLADWWDVIAVAKEDGYFEPKIIQAVEAFLHDPQGWRKDNAHLAKDAG